MIFNKKCSAPQGFEVPPYKTYSGPQTASNHFFLKNGEQFVFFEEDEENSAFLRKSTSQNSLVISHVQQPVRSFRRVIITQTGISSETELTPRPSELGSEVKISRSQAENIVDIEVLKDICWNHDSNAAIGQSSNKYVLSFFNAINSDPVYLELQQPIPVKDYSGFNRWGENSDEDIRAAARKPTFLCGESVEALEEKMRPGVLSLDGFLGKSESLVSTILKDNKTVHEAGTTHRDIGKFLGYFMLCLKKTGNDNATVSVGNRRFAVKALRAAKSAQESPINDYNIPMSNTEYTVTNEQTKASIRFSEMLPAMIGGYGFYEGEGLSGQYRESPENILNLLDENPN